MTDAYQSLRSAAAFLDLSERGKIRVTGEDRARLVNAMSTNQIQHLEPDHGVYAFFLTALGRILADAYIFNLGDSIFLDTEPELGAKLYAHLDKYLIADDAELHDETAQWAVLGIEGPESYRHATSLAIPVPEAPLGLKAYNGGFVVRVASSQPDGLRIFIPPAEKAALLERFANSGLPQASPEEANIVRLENGIPRYGQDITERYLVQETEAMHAVHPNKGCYLGQEIVERVRSRAQVHRYLRSIRIASSEAPAPGTKLQADGKDVAEITPAAYSPALREVVALAYVRTEATLNKPAFVVAGTQPPQAARLAVS